MTANRCPALPRFVQVPQSKAGLISLKNRQQPVFYNKKLYNENHKLAIVSGRDKA